jgi:hypothetical protein
MTDAMTTKNGRNNKPFYLFPVELTDQLLAKVQYKDAELILDESALPGSSRRCSQSAYWRPS